MSNSRWLISATLAGVVVAGSACTQKAADETTSGTTVTYDKSETDKALDATKGAIDETKEAGQEAADGTKNIAEQTVDKTKEIAGATVDKTKEIAGATADKTKEIAGGVGNTTKDVVSTTGETITDGWITTKVSAKFVDETLLKDSNINVDTDDRVVTLKGHVTSNAGRARAAEIARTTEGVIRVVNEIVVRAS